MGYGHIVVSLVSLITVCPTTGLEKKLALAIIHLAKQLHNRARQRHKRPEVDEARYLVTNKLVLLVY